MTLPRKSITNGLAGCSKISAGRADLLDAAFVHDHDAVGDLEGFFLVVGDEDAGDVDLVVQAAEPLAELLAHLGVERAERLVEQEYLGLGGERASQRDALALTAGELRGHRVLVALELHKPQQLVHALANLGLRLLADAQSERDVVEDRHVPKERIVLEDEADVALADGRAGDVFFLVQNGPRNRPPRGPR